MKPKDKIRYIKRKPEVVWKHVDGKTLLLDLKSGSYFEINRTGLAVWKLCSGQQTVESIVAKIAKSREGVNPVRAKEIEDFVSQLQKNKLVECHSHSKQRKARGRSRKAR